MKHNQKSKFFMVILCPIVFFGLISINCNAQTSAQAGENPIVFDQLSTTDNVTYLMAGGAERPSALQVTHATDYPKHFWITGLNDITSTFKWTVKLDVGATYHITALLSSTAVENCEIAVAGTTNTLLFSTQNIGWDKLDAGTIAIPAGVSTITFKKKTNNASIEFKALELIKESDNAAYLQRVNNYKADVSWFSKMPYGVMFQYGPWGYPQTGAKKSLADQTNSFDVHKFVDMIRSTGASYVVWSITWWEYRMNAPINSVNTILGNSSRTSTRDLIGEVADSLQKSNIKFMLYYHTGHDSHLGYNTTDWWKIQAFPASQFTPTGTGDRSVFLNNWMTVVTEIGNRYGNKLDGWFFDDGPVYYPGPFEKMGVAAKAGNPNRFVSYNPFWGPRITDFQEVYFGEYPGKGDVTSGSAPVGGNGIFTNGTHKTQLQHGMFTMENDWGVCKQNQTITTLYTGADLINYVSSASNRRVPLSINILMWEDGTVQSSSLNLLRNLRAQLAYFNATKNTVFNNTDVGITYTGSWSLSSSRGVGDYMNDVQYTTINGDSFEFPFSGSNIEYISEKNTDMGNVDVYIDGVLKQTVSCYNGTRLVQQSIYSMTGLSIGSHVLKVVKKSGAFMLVDALKQTPSKAISPDFKFSPTTIAIGEPIQFTDLSYVSLDTKIKKWNWKFEGGTPATSSLQHPTVTFSTVGTKNIELRIDTGSVNYLSINKDLQVLPAPQLSRKTWSVKSYDSQAQNYEATKSIDSISTTFWHTNFGTANDPQLPHDISYDMGKNATVKGFGYLPRQDGGSNGIVTHYSIFISSDPLSWGTVVNSGYLGSNAGLQTISFSTPKNGRYIRFVIDQSLSTPSNTYASCAEFYAYGIYEAATSVAKVENATSLFSIYPNPCSDITTFFKQDYKHLNILIFNTLGQVVRTVSLTTIQTKINLSELPNGMYIVRSNSINVPNEMKLMIAK